MHKAPFCSRRRVYLNTMTGKQTNTTGKVIWGMCVSESRYMSKYPWRSLLPKRFFLCFTQESRPQAEQTPLQRAFLHALSLLTSPGLPHQAENTSAAVIKNIPFPAPPGECGSQILLGSASVPATGTAVILDPRCPEPETARRTSFERL